MMFLNVPVLTETLPPVVPIFCLLLGILLLAVILSPSSNPRPAPTIAYRSTEEMVKKYQNKETIRMLAKELYSRDYLGKISFNSRGYAISACRETKAYPVYTYSFRELSDIEFSPGEQEAILLALISILPDEYDYRLYYEQPVDSKYPHYFYMKSKRYREAESKGSL